MDGDEGNLIAGDDSENLQNCTYLSFMNTSKLEIWIAYSRQHIASTHRFLQKSVVRKGRILCLQMHEIYINLYSYGSTMFGALEKLIE